MKVALCCIAKLENDYIHEFVEYYNGIGFDKIFIYDNNDVDGERFETVISDYIESGFVDIIDYRGRKQCQQQAYHECYQSNNNEYDWIAFFDCDEFLTLVGYDTIHSFLNATIFNNYQLIHINWLVYGDNEIVYKDSGLVQERFKDYKRPIYFKRHHIYPENFLIKTIIRGGNGDRINWLSPTPHTPITTLSCCNSSGVKCNANESFTWYKYNNAYIKHYISKSIEEWITIKKKRGYPDQSDELSALNTDINQFFLINKVTKEKLNYLKSQNIEYDVQDNCIQPHDHLGVKALAKKCIGWLYTLFAVCENIINKKSI